MAQEPWQTAEIPGPTKAFVITKPAVVTGMVKKAKRAVMVVGHKAVETEVGGERAIDYAIRIARALNVPVVATAHVKKEFVERGYGAVYSISAVEIGNLLQDPSWAGLDGGGRYDVAIFMGLPYYMEWTILSGLKHSAPHLKTITLDPYYQPHASWSFPNISTEEWQKHLEALSAVPKPAQA